MTKGLHDCTEQLLKQQQEHQVCIRDQAKQIRELREEVRRLKEVAAAKVDETREADYALDESPTLLELSRKQIERYSRQLLLNDGFGVEGQRKLLGSSVLVIGAGGIGSSVLLYLAASGVGKICVVDFDQVDRSNLHRQVIHKDCNVGMNKAVSACLAMKDLNPFIQCLPVTTALTHENAPELVSPHDCVVDASDNPLTRYFVNDACVLAGKPLVSGSAIGTEGQVTVYNHLGGPCYRCLYPKPNSTEGSKSCSDSGVLGPVPGLIGIMQSVEVLKVLTGVGSTMHDRLLMYDSLRCSFMNIKKPPKSPKCSICGEKPTLLSMKDSWNVSQSARGPTCAIPAQSTLPAHQTISCADYASIRDKPHVLLDVRVRRQFDMCSLQDAINIPLANLPKELERVVDLSNGVNPVFCICRRGIASSEATRILLEATNSHPDIFSPRNIRGGLVAWSNEVDPSFPKY